MRKLKLQMNFEEISWDTRMVDFCLDNLENVDSILLGRKTAEGFIPYWAEIAKNPDPNDINSRLGRPLTDIPKIVFSNSLVTNNWDNATIIKGDLKEEINIFKKSKGKDIIVYGGNSFVSSLIEHKLIDEYYFLANPLAVTANEPILRFLHNRSQLILKDCKPFPSGSILLYYTQH